MSSLQEGPIPQTVEEKAAAYDKIVAVYNSINRSRRRWIRNRTEMRNTWKELFVVLEEASGRVGMRIALFDPRYHEVTNRGGITGPQDINTETVEEPVVEEPTETESEETAVEEAPVETGEASEAEATGEDSAEPADEQTVSDEAVETTDESTTEGVVSTPTLDTPAEETTSEETTGDVDGVEPPATTGTAPAVDTTEEVKTPEA